MYYYVFSIRIKSTLWVFVLGGGNVYLKTINSKINVQIKQSLEFLELWSNVKRSSYFTDNEY